MRVGVLALQGAFAAHVSALERVGATPILVRTPADLVDLEGLVLPGGESTVHLDLIGRFGLREGLEAIVAAGKPVLATCAGLILAARAVTSPEQTSFGWIDVEVARNAWGRQIHSFEAPSDAGRSLVFIRAPRIVSVGPAATIVDRHAGEPVLVRQGNVVGATFHPELGEDDVLHAELFALGAHPPAPRRQRSLRNLSPTPRT
jgi:pyridoxal 5'-phosphate synthase pdxT subunit